MQHKFINNKEIRAVIRLRKQLYIKSEQAKALFKTSLFVEPSFNAVQQFYCSQHNKVPDLKLQCVQTIRRGHEGFLAKRHLILYKKKIKKN